jgi:hypothetical protein
LSIPIRYLHVQTPASKAAAGVCAYLFLAACKADACAFSDAAPVSFPLGEESWVRNGVAMIFSYKK